MSSEESETGASDWNRRIACELAKIGIDAVESPRAAGFLAKVRILEGRMLYEPDAPPSNLLHEAGHLACMPPEYRHLANEDLSEVFERLAGAYEERYELTGDPDDPLLRAIIQCSDVEATAWAWAFGKRAGIPEDMIILDSEYDGEGASVRLQVSLGMHMGVNGLRAAGMIDSTREYPVLRKWMQDAS